jgi:hypothetical protein
MFAKTDHYSGLFHRCTLAPAKQRAPSGDKAPHRSLLTVCQSAMEPAARQQSRLAHYGIPHFNWHTTLPTVTLAETVLVLPDKQSSDGGVLTKLAMNRLLPAHLMKCGCWFSKQPPTSPSSAVQREGLGVRSPSMPLVGK